MPEKQKKPRSPKQGVAASDLLASIPWLKNKTFFIPALASVLAVSVVGAVLAVQATNSPEVSLDESSSEAVDQPAIGFACVAGTVVCEEVKDILLETDYEEVLRTWTRSSLIDYFVGRHGRSLTFVTEVVDAVRFDWGDGSTYAGGSGSESSTGASSGNSRASGIGGACVRGKVICEAAIYVLIESDQGKGLTRENFIEIWMSAYGATRAEVEGIISAIGFTDWFESAGSAGSLKKRSALEEAAYHVDNFNFSREVLIENLVGYFGHDRTEVISAIDSLNVNWNLEAKQAAENMFSQGPFSQERIRGTLRGSKFLDSEADAGVAALGIDEFSQAELMARDFLMRQTPPCDFSYDFALAYMTEKEYFEREAAVIALLGYLEIDENYNDVWLLCGS